MKSARAGIVVIDKPAGLTSHDVVAQLRREFGTRRVGHGGTLDPMATGVLVIGVEAGTRALQFIADAPKAYAATCRLGQSTNTDDAEGELIASADASGLTDAEIEAAFAGLVGLVQQVPPAYSAIKVAGVRSYKNARAGLDVALAARQVQIDSIEIADIRRSEQLTDVDFSIQCGKGTYVRAVARDVGQVLGVGGHLTALRRTANAGFTLADAAPITDPRSGWLELAAALRRCMPVVTVSAAEAIEIGHGRGLPWRWDFVADPVAVLDESGAQVLAIGKQSADGAHLAYHAVFSPGLAG